MEFRIGDTPRWLEAAIRFGRRTTGLTSAIFGLAPSDGTRPRSESGIASSSEISASDCRCVVDEKVE